MANRFLAKTFRVIGIGWIALVLLVMLASVLGMFLSEPSFYHGWKRVAQAFSPFNVSNAIVTVILFMPALGAFKLKEYFERKAGGSSY